MTGPAPAGVFALDWDGLAVTVTFRAVARRHQGVSLAFREPGAGGAQRLRFDGYDEAAHYHYDPDGRNERHWRDPALHPAPLDWILGLVAERLPAMAGEAGATVAVRPPSAAFMAALRLRVAAVDRAQRQTLLHHPGDHLVRVGGVVFGLGFDHAGGGLSLRILRESAAGLEEMAGFDCYDVAPHCHLGPRRHNVVTPIDVAAVGDPLRWTLDRLSEGRLPALLRAAGYPDAARLAERPETLEAILTRVVPLALNLDMDARAGATRARARR